MIHSHFVEGPAKEEVVEESTIIIDDSEKEIESAIQEARRVNVGKLEDLFDDGEYIEIHPSEFVREEPPLPFSKEKNKINEYTVKHISETRNRPKKSTKKRVRQKKVVKKRKTK